MNAMWRAMIGAMGVWAAMVSPGSAQQPEKRIALVVGNANYTGHALATPANDGGLIAQTLQAAGFDVAGARDLDAESLRRALRDFVQKAQTSGPDTVAFLYLGGYGLQLAGENYFVPVDAAPARDTDVAVDALRVSDYVRQLQSLPLKAGIVVLDAARETPFAKEGQPLAGGLALVEPDPRIFTAFNAAPGTVAPDTAGPYGPYAQALAEMIRTGGLNLPEVFDRVRLRVNETTKGAQIPWDTQKIAADVRFFDRAPDAPATTASLPEPAKPMTAYDASAAYALAVARDTLPDYEKFIAAYPNDAMAKRVRAIIAARREAITWRRSYAVNTPESYWSYLRRYPKGPHAPDARRRLAILTAPLDPPSSFAMMTYDVPPPPPDEIVFIERPYLLFSDPVYGFLPPPPPPVYFLPLPPPDFIILAPPPPVFALYVLPRPYFVPFPAYVVAPSYVAPPPNNLIFANIHNTTVINNVINAPPAATPAAGVKSGPLGSAAPPAGAPALPPSVAQRAALIQQGKLAAPAGVMNRAAIAPAAAMAPAGVKSPAAPGAVPAAAAAPAGQKNLPVQRLAAPPAASPQVARPGTPAAAVAARQVPAGPGAPRPVAAPPVARVAPPARPAPQIQRLPAQAMARPAGPPRMAAAPRPRPAPAKGGRPPPKH